jgi:hypothetical protein
MRERAKASPPQCRPCSPFFLSLLHVWSGIPGRGVDRPVHHAGSAWSVGLMDACIWFGRLSGREKRKTDCIVQSVREFVLGGECGFF